MRKGDVAARTPAVGFGLSTDGSPVSFSCPQSAPLVPGPPGVLVLSASRQRPGLALRPAPVSGRSSARHSDTVSAAVNSSDIIGSSHQIVSSLRPDFENPTTGDAPNDCATGPQHPHEPRPARRPSGRPANRRSGAGLSRSDICRRDCGPSRTGPVELPGRAPVQRLSNVPGFACPGNHLRAEGCETRPGGCLRLHAGLLPSGHSDRESREPRLPEVVRPGLTSKSRLRPLEGYGSHATTARTEAPSAPGRRPVHRCCGRVHSGAAHLRDAAAMTTLQGPERSAQPQALTGRTRRGSDDRMGESAARPC